MDWMTLIERVGVPLALVVYFVWQGSRREDRLSDQIAKSAAASDAREKGLVNRIVKLEDYQRTGFVGLVGELKAVISQNTGVMLRLEKYLESRGPKTPAL